MGLRACGAGKSNRGGTSVGHVRNVGNVVDLRPQESGLLHSKHVVELPLQAKNTVLILLELPDDVVLVCNRFPHDFDVITHRVEFGHLLAEIYRLLDDHLIQDVARPLQVVELRDGGAGVQESLGDAADGTLCEGEPVEVQSCRGSVTVNMKSDTIYLRLLGPQRFLFVLHSRHVCVNRPWRICFCWAG